MIQIELYFQELNACYDVNADENLPVGSLIETLTELIAQKEHLPLAKAPGLFLLCDVKTKRLLHPETTLSQNGIQPGHKLLLV